MRKATIDIPLAIVIFCLIIFGIIMISSVSVYESYQMTNNMVSQGLRDEASNSFYLWRHFWRALISIPIWIFAIYFPLKFWKKAALPFFVITILMLFALFLPGIGANYGTSTSWIDLPFLPSVQPAEMAKLGLIFYLAVWMEKRQELVRSFQYGFIPFTILLSIVVILLAMQPDFGSVLVIAVIAASMFFAAGGSPLHILAGGLLAAAMAYPIIMSKDYIRNRFLTFLNPELDPLNIGFQIKQALIAIGSGGVFGVGFGKSIQKFGYLPEVQGDTIFAAAAEELGFIRISFLVIAYLVIAYRGYKIAGNAQDRFSMLIATGITSWFAFQAIINMGVNLAILPLTGLTLPFVSYGGSSLMVNVLAAGILLNISRYAEVGTNFADRRRIRRAYHPQPRRRVSH
ncbi:putative lipid II flippase FtsW [Patescibacteria group bacterium]|nr:putative lipid II flippase FtsW [Patescibacteria group bacterium]MBU1015714.1 putative lipid II flippase FtsW [Patescibacteria group bacterium]MBU1684886.1 putative lipid II flippase FtsW [Patescibacteria group bacterium]MBU1938656.1 putative lipid II flippase FtsW [Patescibacteria group bacterium]